MRHAEGRTGHPADIRLDQQKTLPGQALITGWIDIFIRNIKNFCWGYRSTIPE